MGDEDEGGTLLDRRRVLRSVCAKVSCVFSHGLESLLVLNPSLEVGVEYPELEGCVTPRGADVAIPTGSCSGASFWASWDNNSREGTARFCAAAAASS